MENPSLWQVISKRTIQFPQLSEAVEVDVAIIGGGITGVTAALQLLSSGQKVAIIEANKIGGETTGNSTGNLYIPVQPYYQNIASKFTNETAKTIAHSRKFAIDYIENNVHEKNIDCHFSRRPWYAYASQEDRVKFLEAEMGILQKIDISVNECTQLPLDLKFKKAILIENQARFNPLQYVISLAEFLHQQGCYIFENSRVVTYKENKDCIVETAAGKVIAKKLIIATHTPIGIHATQLFTAPYRSYVVTARLQEEIYPEGHFWDLDNPSHATCTHGVTENKPQVLMVAGSHHKTGQGKHMRQHYQDLEEFFKVNFTIKDFSYHWSAQHYQSADDVPYIGLINRFAKHTYMATGYFADGLIYGTLAGIILSDFVQGKKNPLMDVYNSTRNKFGASASFVAKENANVLLQYLKDYPLLAMDYKDLKVGEGRVVEINREKWAVSRDQENKLHVVSAVCTHMKCIVNWNDAEKTWDCPCHGSRFCQKGKILEGPALENLKNKN